MWLTASLHSLKRLPPKTAQKKQPPFLEAVAVLSFIGYGLVFTPAGAGAGAAALDSGRST
jgi:hypothetical protein